MADAEAVTTMKKKLKAMLKENPPPALSLQSKL